VASAQHSVSAQLAQVVSMTGTSPQLVVAVL
jgi:hypothetical protein